MITSSCPKQYTTEWLARVLALTDARAGSRDVSAVVSVPGTAYLVITMVLLVPSDQQTLGSEEVFHLLDGILAAVEHAGS